MGTLRVTAQIEGSKGFELESYFENVQHAVADFRDPFERMAEDFWIHEEGAFDVEGPGWVPLSARYSAQKEKKHPGMPILVRTGALKASLTGPFADGAVYEVSSNHMTLGSDLKVHDRFGKEYTLGTLHQMGTRKMPPRPPMMIDGELQRKWNSRLAKWLQTELGVRS